MGAFGSSEGIRQPELKRDKPKSKNLPDKVAHCGLPIPAIDSEEYNALWRESSPSACGCTANNWTRTSRPPETGHSISSPILGGASTCCVGSGLTSPNRARYPRYWVKTLGNTTWLHTSVLVIESPYFANSCSRTLSKSTSSRRAEACPLIFARLARAKTWVRSGSGKPSKGWPIKPSK